jgi:hypothetical protein
VVTRAPLPWSTWSRGDRERVATRAPLPLVPLPGHARPLPRHPDTHTRVWPREQPGHEQPYGRGILHRPGHEQPYVVTREWPLEQPYPARYRATLVRPHACGHAVIGSTWSRGDRKHGSGSPRRRLAPCGETTRSCPPPRNTHCDTAGGCVPCLPPRNTSVCQEH